MLCLKWTESASDEEKSTPHGAHLYGRDGVGGCFAPLCVSSAALSGKRRQHGRHSYRGAADLEGATLLRVATVGVAAGAADAADVVAVAVELVATYG